MKRGLWSLEDFDRPEREREVDRAELDAAVAKARGEGQAAGYAEGFAEAVAKVESETRETLAALVERVGDLELERASARADAIASLRPVVEALIEAAAPVAAEAGLAEAVARAVADRLSGDADPRLSLRVAPERVEAVAARVGEGAEVVADASLESCAARIVWRDGGAFYDPAAALDAAREAIARHFREVDDAAGGGASGATEFGDGDDASAAATLAEDGAPTAMGAMNDV